MARAKTARVKKGSNSAAVFAKNAELKKKYIEFYRQCPIQRRAAQSIRKDQDTIIRWRTADPEFAEAVEEAEADFIRTRLARTGADFQLERLFKMEFSPRQEFTGADGNPLQLNIDVKRLENNPNGLAIHRVSPSGEIQSAEMRAESGEDLPSADDNSQSGDRKAEE